ncbi:MAG: putative Transposase [Saliniramus fredricksonii]|uniref:Putative Transposase n=1 Tax=Saliniramus fredricksonii TaxID=1653334 RepID=A0A0P8A1S6_9HYPH|nr:MAG: putative Transposase [Saliniramus fredricksonii]SCC81954.1 Transposase InsO and inactivated derivatives [Saliniramus fredricksonii]
MGAAAIVDLRGDHPFRGPRKLKAHLERTRTDVSWPAASGIGDLLKRRGLVCERPRRQQGRPVTQPFSQARGPNDVWCADFKGWFRTRNGIRCDPLTISDARSRYLLCCDIVAPTGKGVAPVFERAFREYGLPMALRTDNDPPFATQGAAGLTRLAVSFVKLGIRLERIDPGKPQQNRRHERVHRTLKQETSVPAAATPQQQQARFDRFREIYNTVHPHDALGQRPPAAHYAPETRPYPDRIPEPWYSADHAVRRLRPNGEIKWRGNLIFVSEAVAGEPFGIAETENGDWIVRFCDLDLGIIGRKTEKLHRFAAPWPGCGKAGPDKNRENCTHVPGP